MNTKENPKNLVWWLKLIYTILGVIIGLLAETTTGVASAAINAL